jgi:hypothetical protein
MEEDRRPITASSTPVGSYKFRKMPFGLVNALATFNRQMHHGIENFDNFIEDFIVFTDILEEHLSTLTELFKRLQEAVLTDRPTKCFL